MTQISQPWGGIVIGDATRAPYSDEEWAEMYRDLFREKVDSGPFIGSGASPDIGLTVQQTGVASATVDVTPGSALVRGRWYRSDAVVNNAIGANVSGNPRIDTIILRADYATQTIRQAVLVGTPAGSPVPLSLTQTDGVLWEIPLADVAVANGFATILNANITPRRHFANAADGVYLLDALNNSGVLLETGDVVVWDTTADRAVKTSTTLADPDIVGVWVGRTANGGYGRVLVRGIGYVRTNAAIPARNRLLYQSATAKQAAVAGSGALVSWQYGIGMSLEITGGAGLCLAYIDVRQGRQLAKQIIVRNNGGSYTTTSPTFVDIDGTNLSITLDINTGTVLLFFSAQIDLAGGPGVPTFDFLVNGTRAAAGNTGGIIGAFGNNAVFMAYLTTGVPAGSRVFKPQWLRVSGVNPAQIASQTSLTPVIFGALEVE